MNYWFQLIFSSQKKRILYGLLLACLTALSSLALLALSGWLITATTLAGLAISAGLVFMLDLYLPGSAIRLFALTRTAGRYFERIYNHDTILRLIALYRVVVFAKLTDLPINEIRKHHDSDWLDKLSSDLDALDSLLTRYIIPSLTIGVTIVIATLLLLSIQLELALYFSITTTLLWLLTIKYAIAQTKVTSFKYAALFASLRAEIISHLRGAFSLNPAGLMTEHQQQIKKQHALIYSYQSRLNERLANIQLVLDICLGLGLIIAVLLGLQLVHHNIIGGPSAIMFGLLFLGVSELIQSLPEQFSVWGKTEHAAQRLYKLIDVKPPQQQLSIDAVEHVKLKISKQPLITKSIDTPLNVSLAAHEQLLITGRSGSGKSTLAKYILGIEQVNEYSQVTFNSVDVSAISESSLAACVGYLPQQSEVLAGTIYFNLTLGLTNVDEKRIKQVLVELELWDWIDALPEGIHTWLGETGEQLSGGQARRLCLARLLLRNYDLLILDEPFNGLDSAMTQRIYHNTKQHLSARKSILILHEAPAFIDTKQVKVVSLG